MISSGEVSILTKVAELANRCGFRASEMDGSLFYVDAERDPMGRGYYAIDFGSVPPGKEAYDKAQRFMNLLGLDEESCTLKGRLTELEDAVDRALSLAPRARTKQP